MKNTIVLNWDSDAEFYFIKNLTNMQNLEQQAIEYFDKYYNNPGISDIIFEIFCQTSVTASKVFETRTDKYLLKSENNTQVDYTENEYLSKIYECRVIHNVALTELWIKRCCEIGKNAWISLRMNDNHYRDEDTCFIRSEFFYTALKNGWMLGDKQKYRSGYRNFDYAIPEVREKMLLYIREQLEKIDVYGIQLDFSREPKCLKYLDSEDVCKYMTDFIRGVKKIISDCEKIHGHKIKLAVMLVRDINLAKKIGFDTVTWAKEGLIDVITPNSHWLGCDTGMPISEWCDSLNKYDVDVYAGMEMNLPYRLPIDVETAKGFNYQSLAQGAKKTVIYNLYHIYLSYIKNKGLWDKVPSEKEITDVWRFCADSYGVRRHILTQEMLGFDEVKPRWQPLPTIINGEQTFDINTGSINSGEKTTLYIGIENADIKELIVKINGKSCQLSKNNKDAHILKNPIQDSDKVFAFEICDFESNSISQSISFFGVNDAKLVYLEMKVEK